MRKPIDDLLDALVDHILTLAIGGTERPDLRDSLRRSLMTNQNVVVDDEHSDTSVLIGFETLNPLGHTEEHIVWAPCHNQRHRLTTLNVADILEPMQVPTDFEGLLTSPVGHTHVFILSDGSIVAFWRLEEKSANPWAMRLFYANECRHVEYKGFLAGWGACNGELPLSEVEPS